jgi:tetratricopeptide (TPR) repeat protein
MPQRRTALWLPLIVLALLPLLSACVYFNTFYNAKKSFRQAEKMRREEEKLNLVGAAQGLGRQTSSRRRSGVGSPHQHYERAIVKASKVLEEHKDSDLVDDAMFLIGQAFYWQGDYLNAARTFADLVSNFPDSKYALESRLWRGRAHQGQGAFSEARGIYRGLVRDGGSEIGPLAGFEIGEMAVFERDYIAAIGEYRLILESFPKAANRARIYLRLGEALIELEDEQRYLDALEAFERVLEANPSLEEEYRARMNRGRVFFAQDKKEQALRTYNGLIKERRFRAFEGDTRLLIGEYYQETRELERAIEEYERVRDDFPQTDASAMALYRTGLLYLQSRGDIERAREYFKEVPQEKRNAEAVQLGRDRLKDLDARDRLIVKIRRADSTTTAKFVWKDEDAKKDTLVKSDTPQVHESLLELAELYRAKLGQADSASFYFREAIERFPEDREVPRTLYALAWIELELNLDLEASRPHLEQLIEVYPFTEQANAARQALGLGAVVSDEDKAQKQYAEIERLWLDPSEQTENYVPRLDSLARQFPDTRVAPRALFMGGRALENSGGDSVAAEARFTRITDLYPRSEFAELVKERKKALEAGLWEKMQRDLKAIGRVLKAGEAAYLLAVEPDSVDSNSLGQRHFGYGLRAQRRGDFDDARREYELSLEQVVRNPRALHYLGDITLAQGEPHDAKEYYLEALRFRRGQLGPLYGLVSAYTAMGVADSATYYLREAVKKDRNSVTAEQLRSTYPEELTDPEPLDFSMDVLEELEYSASEEVYEIKPRDLKLSEGPLVRKSVVPTYPTGAGGDSARVLIDVLVAKDGLPEIVEVYAGAEPYAAAAVEAAQKYTFFPAEDTRERKRAAWVEIELIFAQQETVIRPEPEVAAGQAPSPESAIEPETTTPAIEGEQ